MRRSLQASVLHVGLLVVGFIINSTTCATYLVQLPQKVTTFSVSGKSTSTRTSSSSSSSRTNTNARRQQSSISMVQERISAMQAVLDFNRDFKAGLKFILVPQYELKKRALEVRRGKDAALAGSSPSDFSIPDQQQQLDDTSIINQITSNIVSSSSSSSGSSGSVDTDPSTVSTGLLQTYSDFSSALSSVAKTTSNNALSMDKFQPALEKSEELRSNMVSAMSTVTSSLSNSISSSSVSVPDLTILRDTLTNALPEKSVAEIKEMTNKLADISSIVQERGRQLDVSEFLQDLSKDIPDLTAILGEKYQTALLDIISSDKTPAVVLSELKERIIAMDLVQVRNENMPEITYVPSFPVEKVDAVFDNLNQLFQIEGWTLPDLIRTLDFQELGGWYSGSIVGVFFVASILAKSKTPPYVNPPSRPATTTVTKPMPTLPKLPTALFAKGKGTMNNNNNNNNQQSKPTPVVATVDVISDDKVRLESLVSDLTLAITALSKELRELKLEKAKTDYDLASMKSDVRTLRNAIEMKQYTSSTGTSNIEVLQKEAEIGTTTEINLQKQLQIAQQKVVELEIEKQSLKNEIIELTTTVVSQQQQQQQLKPLPPSVPPPKVMLKPTTSTTAASLSTEEKVWFASEAPAKPATSSVS